MKKIGKILLLFVVFQFSSYSFSQNYLPYYHLVNEARWQSYKKNYAGADSLYKTAFSLVNYIQPAHSLEAAKNAMAYGNEKSCYQYSLQSLSNGMYWDSIRAINNFESTKSFSKLQSKKDKFKATFLKKTDKYWRELVDSMSVRDQLGRSDAGMTAMQFKYDSINLCIIKETIRKFGRMPGLREVGYGDAQKLDLIFRHVEQRYRLDTLAHVILEQSLKGDFPPENPAKFIDHACFLDADRPYYFTRVVFGYAMIFQSEELVLLPFRNPDCVNKLRDDIGLMPLERMIEMRKIKVYSDKEFEEKYKKFFMNTPSRRPFIVNCNISEL